MDKKKFIIIYDSLNFIIDFNTHKRILFIIYWHQMYSLSNKLWYIFRLNLLFLH